MRVRFFLQNVSRIGPFSLSLRFGLSAEQLQLRLRTCFHSTRSAFSRRSLYPFRVRHSALFRLLKRADVSVENSIYRFSIQTLLHLLRPGQSLFAGGIPPSFKKEAAENNVAVFDYADDISLPVYNSISLQKAQSAKRSSTVLSICTKQMRSTWIRKMRSLYCLPFKGIIRKRFRFYR